MSNLLRSYTKIVSLLHELKTMIERSVYNRRRRSLAFKIEDFREKIAHQAMVTAQKTHYPDD